MIIFKLFKLFSHKYCNNNNFIENIISCSKLYNIYRYFNAGTSKQISQHILLLFFIFIFLFFQKFFCF